MNHKLRFALVSSLVLSASSFFSQQCENCGIGANSPASKLEIRACGVNSSTSALNVTDSNGTSALFVRDDRRIGIGTTNPLSLLQLKALGFNWDDHLNLEGSSGDIWNILVDGGAANKLRIRNRATGIEAITFLTNGNVGIGTPNPSDKLDIVEADTARIKLKSTTASAGAQLQVINNEGAYASVAMTGSAYLGSRAALFLGVGNGTAGSLSGVSYGSYLSNAPVRIWVNGSTKMFIDTLGNVGIGNSSPASRLDINDGNAVARFSVGSANGSNLGFGTSYLGFNAARTGTTWDFNGDGANNGGGVIYNNIAGSIYFSTIPSVGANTQTLTDVQVFNNIKMTVLNTGEVGIGLNNPTEKLHVNGNGLFVGTVSASCGILSCSDIRYKADILPLNNTLKNVLSMKGVYYNWKVQDFPHKNFTERLQIGIIAQELEKIYPELVFTDSDGYKSVDYSKLTPILVEAIKEQQKIIDSQAAKIEKLESKAESIHDLNNRIEGLEKVMKKIANEQSLEVKK